MWKVEREEGRVDRGSELRLPKGWSDKVVDWRECKIAEG